MTLSIIQIPFSAQLSLKKLFAIRFYEEVVEESKTKVLKSKIDDLEKRVLSLQQNLESIENDVDQLELKSEAIVNI